MKIYYSTKILINGLFPLNNFKFDDFIEKTGVYDETILNIQKGDSLFYISEHMLNGMYSCEGKKENFYEYFENDKLFEKEIDNTLTIEEISRLIFKEEIKKVKSIQKRLRLLTGFGISLPVFKTTILDSNKNFLTHTGYSTNESTYLKITHYTESMKKTIEKRAKLYISDSAISELENKNTRFKRALNFYEKSFSSHDKGIRLTLLFSAIESLFNITGKNVNQEISNYASKILFLSKVKTKNSNLDLRRYYKFRSNYIHGNNGFIITEEIENNLREYVREIILIYWNVSVVYNKFDANEIKKLINTINTETVDIQVQIFIKYLRTEPENFNVLYKKIKENFLNDNFNILNNINIK